VLFRVEGKKGLCLAISDLDGQATGDLLKPWMAELFERIDDPFPRPELAGI